MISRLTIITGAGALAVGLLAGWLAQGWRLGAELERERLDWANDLAAIEAERVEAAQRVRKTEGEIHAKYETALNQARDRERALRADLVAVQHASDGLRTQAAEAARRLAQAPAPAVLEYANTVSAVFDECQARYGEVAAAADGHHGDARALVEAWPVIPAAP